MQLAAYRRASRIAHELLPEPANVDLSAKLKCGGLDPSAVGCLAGLPLGLLGGLLGQGVATGGYRFVVFAGGEVIVFKPRRWFSWQDWIEFGRAPTSALRLEDADSFLPRLVINDDRYWLPMSLVTQVKQLLPSSTAP